MHKKGLKILITIMMVVMTFPLSSHKLELEATTDLFGEIEYGWMNGLYGSVIKQEDGRLFAAGRNWSGNLGLGATLNHAKFSPVLFHKQFYGKGAEIIEYTNSYAIGWLLDSKGRVYYSSTASTTNYDGMFGSTAALAKFPANADEGRIGPTAIAGQFIQNTRGQYVLHPLLDDLFIVDIDAVVEGLVMLDSNGNLWGIGRGGNTYSNVFGMGATPTTKDLPNQRFLIAQNVSEFNTAYVDEESNTYANRLFYKKNGLWYALGSADFNATLAGIKTGYITNADFTPGETGRLIDLSEINSVYGQKYTHTNIVQIQGYARSTMILMDDGVAYQAGRAHWGSMDANSATPIRFDLPATPEYVAELGPGATKIVKLFPASHAIYVQAASGRVWGKGNNDGGDLGFSTQTNPVPVFTDISDPDRTGEFKPTQLYYGVLLKSPTTVMFPRSLYSGWNGSTLVNQNGYIMGTGANNGFYGSSKTEVNMAGWAYTRILRENRVVRDPSILVNGNRRAVNWQVNPTIEIGQLQNDNYSTYVEYQFYACTSQDESTCTTAVNGATNAVAGTTYTPAHDANYVGGSYYQLDYKKHNLPFGYYKVVAKRYAFIGPDGSKAGDGSKQYNEEGTDIEYFVRIVGDPELNVPSRTTLTVGESFDPTKGVVAKTAIGGIVPFGEGVNEVGYQSNVDIHTPGLYTVNYQFVDPILETGVTKIAQVLVTNQSSIIDDTTKVMLQVDGFNLDMTQIDVTGTIDELLSYAKPRAWDLNTNQPLEVDLISADGYTNRPGGYKPTFKVNGHDVQKQIQINIFSKSTVIVGDLAIDAHGFTIQKKNVLGVEDLLDVSKTGIYAWNTLNSSEPLEVEIINAGGYVKGASEGVYQPTFGIKTHETPRITIDVLVVDVNQIVQGDGFSIGGNPIEIRLEDLQNMTDEDIIRLTGARSWNNSKIEDTSQAIIVDNPIQLYEGEYPVTFESTQLEGLQITLPVVVIDNHRIVQGNAYHIGANDINIPISDVQSYDDQSYVIYSNARSWSNTDVNNQMEAVVASKQVKAEAGSYDITFESQQEPGLKVTSKVNVIDANHLNSGQYYGISANNFFVGKKEMSKLTDQKIIELSNARGWKSNLYNEDVEIAIKPYILSGDWGLQEVTLYVVNEPTVEVTIYIDTILTDYVSVGKTYMIGASDFVLGVKDVETLNNDLLIKSAGARSYYRNEFIDAGTVNVLNQNIEPLPGGYIVDFFVKEEPTTKVSSTATVVYDDYGITRDGITVTGNDFYVNSMQAREIINANNTDEKIIELARAKGWDMRTLEEYPLSVISKFFQENEGVYPNVIGFGDIKITINIHVNNGQSPSISMTTPVELKVGETFDLRADVKVIDDRDENLDFEVVGDFDSNQPGIYVIQYRAQDSDYNITNTPRVIVVNDGTFVVGQDSIIRANDFVVATNDMNGLDDEILNLSNARAYSAYDGHPLAIEVQNRAGYDIIEGNYQPTIVVSQDDQVAQTINAVVLNGKIVKTDLYSIRAKDFYIGLSDAKKMDDQTLLDKSDALGWKNSQFSTISLPLEITNNQIKAKAGIYPTNIAIREDLNTNIDIEVNVLNYDEVSVNDQYIVAANDFTIQTNQVASLTNEEIINKSNATTWLIKDPTLTQDVVVVRSEIEAKEGRYEVILQRQDGSTTLSIFVNVVDNQQVVNNPNYGIAANHFDISINDFGKLSDQFIIEQAHASTWEQSEFPIRKGVSIVPFEYIKVEGTYPITFVSSLDPELKITIYMNIVNNDQMITGEAYSIGANDIIVKLNDIDTLTDEQLIQLSHAKAWNREDVLQVHDVKVTSNTIAKASGTYQVELTSSIDPNLSIIVQVHVLDSQYLNLNDSFGITANDFEIQLNQVKDLTDTQVILLSGAYAFNIDNISVQKGVKLESQLNMTTEGTYDLVFSSIDDPTLTITSKMRVIDNTQIQAGNNFHIGANDIEVSLSDIALMSDEMLIALAKARSWNPFDLNDQQPAIIVNKTIQNEVGQYTITFESTQEKGLKITSQVNIIDAKIIQSGDTYSIGANPIQIKLNEVKDMNDSEWILRAQAKSWNQSNIDELYDVKIINNTVEAKEGQYTLTIQSTIDPSLTIEVPVIVTDVTQLVIGESFAIGASDFEINIDQVDNLTDDLIIQKAKAKTWSNNDLLKTFDVFVQSNLIMNQEGTYEVSFVSSQDDRLVVSVNVTVIDNEYIKQGEGVSLSANDFDMKLSEVSTLTPEMLIAKANARTWKTGQIDTLQSATLLTHTIENQVGSYNVTFNSPLQPELNLTVKVNVVDLDEIQDGNHYSIGANSFVIGLKEASVITAEQIIQKSNVRAWKTIDFNTLVDVALTDATIIPIAGIQLVEAYVIDEPETKVNIIVQVVNNDYVSTNQDWLIAANNFKIGLNQAKSITSNQIIQLSNASTHLISDAAATGTVEVTKQTIQPIPNDYLIELTNPEQNIQIEVSATVLNYDEVFTNHGSTIVANDIYVNSTFASTMTESDIIQLANAHAWHNHSELPMSLHIKENNLIATEGIYTITFEADEDDSLQLTIQVHVTNGTMPKLNVTSPIVLSVGDTFDYQNAGILAEDAEDGVLVPIIDGTYQKDVPGVYVIQYQVTDSDFNIVKASRVIVVNDGRYIVSDDYIITAQDFVMSKQQMAENHFEILEQSKAHGFNSINGEEVLVEVLDDGGYRSEAGSYQIKVAIKNQPETFKQINTIILEGEIIVGNQYSITANPIQITKVEAKQISDQQLIEMSDAHAWLNTNYVKDASNVEIKEKTIEPKPGQYSVTYQVINENETQIVSTVDVLDFEVINREASEAIAANNLELKLSEVSTLTDEMLISRAGAITWSNGQLDQAVSATIKENTIINAVGQYTVTFSSSMNPNLTTTIHVNVVDRAFITTGDQYAIAANNFAIKAEDAKNLNDELIIQHAKATVYQRLNPTSLGHVIVVTNLIEAKNGVYEVVLSASEDPSISITIEVQVVEAAILEVGNEWLISGNHFEIRSEDVDALDDQKIIELANVQSWNKNNIFQTSEIHITENFITSEEGTYLVTFESKQEPTLTLTILVNVINNEKVHAGQQYSIGANDFDITLLQAKNMTDEQFVQLANAKSWNRNDLLDMQAATIQSKNIAPIEGTYTIQFVSTQDSNLTIDVFVNVIDATQVETGKEYAIAANRFTIKAQDVSTLTDQQIIANANAFAYERSQMNNHHLVEVINSNIQPNEGNYYVSFASINEPDLKITIQVHVIDSDLFASNDIYQIGANRITLTKNELEQLDNQLLIDKANARTWNQNDLATMIPATVKTHNIEMQAGQYNVTFTSSYDQSLTLDVPVFVVDAHYVESGQQYQIAAKDINIKLNEVETISDSQLLYKANAKSWNKVDPSNMVYAIVKSTTIKPKEGVYTITFESTQEPGLTITTQVNVLDFDYMYQGSHYSIGANSFVIGLKELRQLDDYQIKTLSNLKAWSNQDPTQLVSVSLQEYYLMYDPGIQVFGAYVDQEVDTEIQFEMNVMEADYAKVSDFWLIQGNDFVIGLKDVATLNDQSIIERSNTQILYDGNTQDTSQIKVQSNSIIPAVGRYPIVLEINNVNDLALTVHGEVVNFDHANRVGQIVLSANDLLINATMAGEITDQQIIELAKAQAIDVSDFSTYPVQVKSHNIEGVEGEYQATLIAQDAEVTITIHVTNGIAPTLNVTSPIELALNESFDYQTVGVEAFDDKDQNLDVVVEGTFDPKVAGIYVINYSVTDSDFNTVRASRVIIVNDGSFIVGDQHILRAQDFVMSVQNMNGSNNEILTQSKAISYHAITGMQESIQVLDNGGYQVAVGEYSIQIASMMDPSLTKTITAHILPGRLVTNEQYAISANDFTISRKQAQDINASQILEKSNSRGFEVGNFDKALDIDVVSQNIQPVEGIYPIDLALNIDANTKIQVNAIVTSQEALQTNKQYALAANSIELTLDQAKTMTDEKYIALANAKTWALNTQDYQNATIIENTVELKAGQYQMTFASPLDASLTLAIQVSIIDREIIHTDNDYLIAANQITIQANEVASMDDSKWIQQANALAYARNNPNEPLEIIISDNQVSANEGVYDLTFKISNTDVILTIPVTVVSASIIEQLGKNWIAADHFEIQSSDVLQLTDDKIIELANARSWNQMDFVNDLGVIVSMQTIKQQTGLYTVTFTSKVDPQLQITINVTVIDLMNVVNNKNYGIGANHFSLTSNEALNITDEMIVEKAQAKTWVNNQYLQAEKATLKNSKISDKPGIYQVTFSSKYDASLEIVINVLVTDNQAIEQLNNYGIGANDFTIRKSDVAFLLDEQIIASANANSWSLVDFNQKQPAIVESHQVKEEAGNYQVVFRSPYDDQLKLARTITVVDFDEIAVGSTYQIAANNFDITLDEAKQLTETDYISRSNATTWIGNDYTKHGDVKLSSIPNVQNAGVYTIEFGSVNELGLKVKVSMNVIDSKYLNIGNQYRISANPITVKINELLNMTNNDLVLKAKAQTWDKADVKTLSDAIFVSSTIEYVEGTYQVTFAAQDEPSLQITVPVYVIDADIINRGINYDIAANNFEVTQDQVSKLTNQDIVNLAHARSWKADNFDASLQAAVLQNGILAKEGVYDVTFESTQEAKLTITIQVTVISNRLIHAGDSYSIGANPINLTLQEARDISFSKLIELANARSWKTGDIISAQMARVNASTIEASAGTYQVTFASIQEPSLTIQIPVNVIDAENIVTGNQYGIAANRVVIGMSEVNMMSEADLIERSKAHSWNTLNSQMTSRVAIENYQLNSVVGIQTLTFYVVDEPETKIQVQVEVVDADKAVVGKQYVIKANDMIIGIDDAIAITNEQIINLSKAQAYQLDNPQQSGLVRVEKHEISGAVGTYPVTLSVEQEPSTMVSIQATVVNADVASRQGDFAIMANHIHINTNTVKTLDDAKIIELAKAKAWQIGSNQAIDIQVTGNNVNDQEGVYQVTLQAVNATITIQVFVSDGMPPQLTVTTPIMLSLNDSFDIQTEGITVSDDKDTNLVVEVIGTLDTTIEGIYPITYQVIDSDGNTVRQTRVIVVNNGNYILSGDIILTANNFVILKDQVTTTHEEVFTQSNVIAINGITGENEIVEIIDLGGYTSEVGQYTLTLGAKNDQTKTITIQAVVVEGVIAKGNAYILNANHFELGLQESRVITDQMLIEKATAQAIKNAGIEFINGEIIVSKHNIKAQEGMYQVTFAVKEEMETTITVDVYVSNNEYIQTNGQYTIGANGIVMRLSDVLNASDANYIERANAMTWSKLTPNDKIDAIIIKNGVEAKTGIYEMTFGSSLDSELEITIQVQVIDKDIIATTLDYAIAANSFELTTAQASTITNEQIISKASAIVWNRQKPNEILNAKIVEHNIASIEGQYLVVFKSDQDEKLQLMVKVNVIDLETINQNNGYSIGANPITIKSNEVNTLTDAQLIDLAKAKAWNTSDLNSLLDVKVKSNQMQPAQGIYEIIYTTNDEQVEVKSTITIIEADQMSQNDQWLISANDLVLTDKQATEMNDQQIINDAKAKVLSLKDLSSVDEIDIAENNIQPFTGIYQVTFASKTQPDLRVTIQVMVIENEKILVTDDVIMAANNFVIAQSEVSSLTDERIIQYAFATAYKRSDLSLIQPIKVVENQIQEKEGSYLITLSQLLNPEVKITIQAVVITGEFFERNDETIITGNRIIMGVKQAQNISDEQLIKLADAHALTLKGDIVDVKVKQHNVQAIPGNYRVTFTTTNEPSASMLIMTHVLNADYVYANNRYQIQANDFNIYQSTIDQITDDQLITLAGASAIDKDTLEPVEIKVASYQLDVNNKMHVTFEVVNDPTVQVTVQPTRILGQSPTLEVNPLVQLNLGQQVNVLDNVHATDAEDGLLEVNVEGEVNVNQVGLYTIVYSVIDLDGNQVTATTLFIVNDGTYQISNDVIIGLNDARIHLREVNGSNKQLFDITNAQAFDLKGNPIGMDIKDNGQYKAEVGKYKIVFVASDQERTALVNVYNQAIETQTNNLIVANNLVLTTNQVAAISDQMLIEKAQVEAWYGKTGLNPAEVKVISQNIKPLAGVYEATFAIVDDLSTQITIQVFVSQSVVQEIKKPEVSKPEANKPSTPNMPIIIDEFIDANDFAIRLADLNEANVIKNANAISKRLINGLQVQTMNVTIVGALPTSTGIYQVTFESPLKVRTTVTMHVGDDIYNDYIIRANAGTMYRSEVSRLIDRGILTESIITRNQPVVYNYKTGQSFDSNDIDIHYVDTPVIWENTNTHPIEYAFNLDKVDASIESGKRLKTQTVISIINDQTNEVIEKTKTNRNTDNCWWIILGILLLIVTFFLILFKRRKDEEEEEMKVGEQE